MPDILSEFLKLIGGVAAIGAVSCAFAYATFRSRSPRETCRTIRLVFFFQHASVIDVEAIEEIVALTNQTVYANQPAQRQVGARDKAWFALDSPLEGDGFELPVPERDQRGTESSNPSSSSGESRANLLEDDQRRHADGPGTN
jgi:hypothetical protein